MKELKFKNEYDKKDFFELFENNCLKEINEYNYLKLFFPYFLVLKNKY